MAGMGKRRRAEWAESEEGRSASVLPYYTCMLSVINSDNAPGFTTTYISGMTAVATYVYRTMVR